MLQHPAMAGAADEQMTADLSADLENLAVTQAAAPAAEAGASAQAAAAATKFAPTEFQANLLELAVTMPPGSKAQLTLLAAYKASVEQAALEKAGGSLQNSALLSGSAHASPVAQFQQLPLAPHMSMGRPGSSSGNRFKLAFS